VSADVSKESSPETDRDEFIRRRAYDIWLSEGCPEGRENDHWEQAAREIADGAHHAQAEAAEGPVSTRTLEQAA